MSTLPTSAASGDRVWTEDRIRALGAVTDLPTAARIFGLGRALAYELAKNNDFPVPVLRVGSRYRVPVAPLLAALPERDRHILSLRFYRGWTQRQIAADIGVTQMQVSRLLGQALNRLREAAA